VRDVHKHANIKINTVFNVEFIANDRCANKCQHEKLLFRTFDLREWYELRDVESILTSLEEFQERDSGRTLPRILNLAINVNKYNPLYA